MNLTSKKSSLIILAVTSLVLSRIMFVFFNDPEGPNLLIVLGIAVIVYLLSLLAYFFIPSITNPKKLLLSILTQIIVVAILYFFLN